jgi:septum formation protein
MKVILASTSPRRVDLLRTLGYIVTPISPNIKEKTGEDIKDPEELVLYNAKIKAEQVYNTYGLLGADFIVAADTIVVANSNIFEKPKSLDENKIMLSFLSAKSHQVVTAYNLINAKINKTKVVTSEVVFRNLSKEEIESYVNTGEGRDKAGGYGLQGLGIALVKEVKGSITNVIGLPLEEFIEDVRGNS